LYWFCASLSCRALRPPGRATRYRRFQVRRNTDDFQIAAALGRAGIIPDSSDARIASMITMRCSSIGSEVMANSTFLNFSRASATCRGARSPALSTTANRCWFRSPIGEVFQPSSDGPSGCCDRVHRQDK